MVHTDEMDDDFLTDAEKQILPASVRVNFPVRDLPTTAYRQLSEELRALAMDLEEMYLMRDRSQTDRRFTFGMRLRQLAAKVKYISQQHGTVVREGRPKNSERAEHIGERWETVSNCEPRRPQLVVPVRHQ